MGMKYSTVPNGIISADYGCGYYLHVATRRITFSHRHENNHFGI